MVPAMLPEVLDFEHVRHDLLRPAITVGVHERNMVALCDHIADGREPLLNAPKGENAVRKSSAVSSRSVVVESTPRRARLVARREEAADDLRAADGGVHDGEHTSLGSASKAEQEVGAAFGWRRGPALAASVTPVGKILSDTIKANGPVSFATYMQLCLSHPTEGYYMNPGNAVIGARGDFITSPEISQVFGELLGIWLLSRYLSSGAKHDVQLVELGPGRGTLMDDILRTLSQFPHSSTSVKHVRLIESSPALRAVQEEKLREWDGKGGLRLHWHDSIDDVPAADGVYTMVVAHEFFDALPFHLIEKTHQGWKEVLITSTPDPAARTILRSSDILTSSQSSPSASAPAIPSHDQSSPTPQPRFRPILGAEPSPVSTLLGGSSPRFASLPISARIEVSATSFQIARKLGTLISQGAGGSGLVIDYGTDHAVGSSFRAFKDHKLTDPFDRPGQADLTANVDFAYLAEALAGTATAHGPLSQRSFLLHMGIGTRVAALQRTAATQERADALEKAAARLVDATGMGREYKVMAVTGGVDSVTEEVWPFIAGEVQEHSTDVEGPTHNA